MFRLLLISVLTTLSFSLNAQVIDSIRYKNKRIDTLIKVTQQDFDSYLKDRNNTPAHWDKNIVLTIIKGAKFMSSISKITYQDALAFHESNQRFTDYINQPINENTINEYITLRKLTIDTVGKTANYRKIIANARHSYAQGEFLNGLYPKVNYIDALIEAEEFIRLRSLVDKVLVIKSARKLYLYKDGKVLKTYPIALGFSPVGQKEREGDGKTPEGIYKIDYNTTYDEKAKLYSFHLSYPNNIDKARAKTKGLTAGSHIMIHGTSKGIKKRKDWTNGCIAISNTALAEFQSMVFTGTEVEIRK